MEEKRLAELGVGSQQSRKEIEALIKSIDSEISTLRRDMKLQTNKVTTEENKVKAQGDVVKKKQADKDTIIQELDKTNTSIAECLTTAAAFLESVNTFTTRQKVS